MTALLEEPCGQACLQALVDQAGRDLEGAPAEEVLAWGYDVLGDDLVITSSMAEAVLVDMASRIRPGAPVLFVDTGYHFSETLGTLEAVKARYDVDLVVVKPALTVPQQDSALGERLFGRDPDRCCALRKVEPLERGLAPYAGWASGLRRAETFARRHARVVEWDARREKVKVNPLAAWTDEDVHSYVVEHDVVVNPLLAAGYPSIGCAPCTRPVGPGEDARAGRWAGLVKTECGIHT